MLGCFITEHMLPYSLSGPLLELCKHFAKDPKALAITSMERVCATYTITHGIAHDVKDVLAKTLRDKTFSLNIDEATNNAGQQVLNVLVQVIFSLHQISACK